MEKGRAGIGKTVIAGTIILIIIIATLAYVALSPRPLVHDIAIAGVVPDSVAVPQGLNIKVNVTVRNQGSFPETFNVSVTLPQNSSTQKLLLRVADLSAGAEKRLTFDWNTADLSIGDYRINMTAFPVENETDIADNSLSTVLTLSNKAMLRTSMGNITIELFQDMPITTKNFKNLTWLKVYDETLFHRVVKFFVIQGGDPTSKGYPAVPRIKDELPNKHSNFRGTIAMAKTQEANSATSEFYINLNNTNSLNLDSFYSVFGRVLSGMNVADQIGNLENDHTEKPSKEIRLIKVEFIK
jgi:peptidylprolyl isomerase